MLLSGWAELGTRRSTSIEGGADHHDEPELAGQEKPIGVSSIMKSIGGVSPRFTVWPVT
jgi:hypothetical protein